MALTGAALDEIIASVKEDGYELPEKNTVRKYLTGEAPTKRTFTSYQDYIKSKGFLAVIENGENHKQTALRIYASMGSSSLPLRLVFSTPALRIFPLSLVMVVTISSLVMVVTIFPLSLVMVVTIFPLSLVMVVAISLMGVTISFLLVMVVSC